MKKLHLLLLTILFCSAAHALEKGQPGPDFALQDAAGNTVTMSSQQGNIVLLDFWASWCGPCKKSLPWLDKIQTEFSNERFRIIAINLDTNRSDANRMLADLNLKLRVAFDPEGNTPEAYQLDTMPSSFLLDQNGHIVRIFKGFDESEKEEIKAAIANLLEESKK